MLESCAYSFPAVLQSFGKKYWQDLEGLYTKLLKDS